MEMGVLLRECFCSLMFSDSFWFSVQGRRGWPDSQSLFFACAKKSNQKKAHNLTKIDPDITYSLWAGIIQYTLAAPTKTFFTRLSCSSIFELASSQHHSDSADFFKTQCGCNEQVQQASFLF